MEDINELMPLSHDWNKERLNQLKSIMPDIFTSEGELNIEELKKIIDPESVSETERYEFRWFGKSAAKRNAFTPSNATLVFDEHRSVNPNTSENLIIEGENLEVLKLLSAGYREQVKCIYIDPPYNTGKDFVYSDNFTEDKKPYWEQTGVTEDGLRIDTNAESDGRYHSNWLNMMFSRLLIARQLLREDGVIFISIDDNEVHHLRKLCDEVFGEENFISELVRRRRKTQANLATHIAPVHEYVVIYAKSKEELVIHKLPYTKEFINLNFSNPDNDPRGLYQTGPLARPESSSNPEWELTLPNGRKITARWSCSPETYKRYITENRLVIPRDGEGMPRIKIFLCELDGQLPNTWLDDVASNDEASTEIENILGSLSIFTFPKPTGLIKRIVQLGMDKNDIILDFFGGSGTTGHSIMEMNKDGGNRKYILVQIPELTDENSEAYKAGYKKISDITIERNKRVVEKLIEEKKNKQADLFDGQDKETALNGLGFKVLKLVKSNFPRVEWAPDVEKTDEENIATLKQYINDKEAQLVTAFNRNDLLTEILLKKGYQLNYKTEKQEQFENNEVLLVTDGINETLICLDVVIADETMEYFKTHVNKKFICLERALDTTKKWNLKHYLKKNFSAF